MNKLYDNSVAQAQRSDNFVAQAQRGDNSVAQAQRGDNFVAQAQRGDNFVAQAQAQHGDHNFRAKKQNGYIKESYNDYLVRKKIVTERTEKSKDWNWIYNIIDGKSEQDKIVYNDDNFLIVPDIKYCDQNSQNNQNDENSSNSQETLRTIVNSNQEKKYNKNVHYLSIVKDKSITSLRDLNASHIPLLESMIEISINKLSEHLGIDKNKFFLFLHYPPSAWLLHIHIISIDNDSHRKKTTCEYSHSLYQIIHNLKLDSDYYKNIAMYVYKA